MLLYSNLQYVGFIRAIDFNKLELEVELVLDFIQKIFKFI